MTPRSLLTSVLGLWLAAAALPGCATTSAQGITRAPRDAGPKPWETPEGANAARSDLARWYIDNGLTGQAMEIVSDLREAGVDGPEIDLMQAEALAAEGLLNEAEHLLVQVVPALPNDPRPYRVLGVVYADQQRVEEATAALRSAVALEDDHAPTLNNLGYLLLAQDECDEALATFQTVMDRDATEARYRNNLALALVCTQQPEEALRLFRSTMREAEARYNTGAALERYARNVGAALQYEAALDADPDHDLAAEALARLTADAGDLPLDDAAAIDRAIVVPTSPSLKPPNTPEQP